MNQNQRLQTLVLAVAAILIVGCASNTVSAPESMDTSTVSESQTDSESKLEQVENPLLEEWTGPYGGVPEFDRMEIEDLKPALQTGMAMNLEEIDAIAANPEPPTFENTIVALERSGRDIGRIFTYWGIWRSNRSTPESRAVQQEMAPELAQFRSQITQNTALFERIKSVYESDEMNSLRPDQKRLVWLVYDGFARDGATLDDEAKERYAAINQELAELHSKFSNNVLADEEGYVEYLTEDQLSGLSDSFIKAAAAAAAERGHEGKYAITNTRSSMDPFLTFSTERGLREKVCGPTIPVATTVTNTTTMP